MFIADKPTQVVDNGVVANFVPGVARPLRESLVNKALAMGVRRVGDEKAAKAAECEETATLEEVVSEIRKAMTEGDKGLFTRTGNVSARVLERRLEKSTTAEQREKAMELVNAE